jgi:hypothetical protein
MNCARILSCRPALRLTLLIVAIGCLHVPTAARAAEFDDEHIFGFTEGTAIGSRGEREVESTFTGRLGKPGSYFALTNETALRYGVTDDVRIAGGVLLDYHALSQVPGLDDRTGFGFGGITTELRWRLLRFDRAPVGLTLSVSPQWVQLDDLSGQPIESYAVPFTVLADRQMREEKLFTAFNFTVAPTFTRVVGGTRQDVPMEGSLAGAVAVAPGVFFGGEVRHLNHNLDGFLTGHALFVGPSLYVGVSEAVAVKLTWSKQIPDESTGGLDLVNYERDQFRLVLVKSF